MTKKLAWMKWPKLRTAVLRVSIFLGMVVLLQGVLFAVNKYSVKTPIVGLRFAGQFVTFNSSKSVREKTEQLITKIEKNPSTIRVGDYTETISPRQLGVKYDCNKITENILRQGRQGSVWHQIVTQDKALLGQTEYKIGFTDVDEGIAKAYLEHVAAKVDKPAQNARFVFRDNGVVVESEVAGTKLNLVKSLDEIRHHNSLSTEPFEITAEPVKASIKAADIESLKPVISSAVSMPLKVQAKNAEVTLSPEQIVSLYEAKRINETTIDMSYDEAKVNSLVDGISQKINIDPKPKVVKGGSLVDSGARGTQLDVLHSKIAIVSALKLRTLPLEERQKRLKYEKTVVLPYTMVDPPTRTIPVSAPVVKNIYLTFDDGPNQTTAEILDILKKYGVHATFFITGQGALAFPDIAKRIVNEGHTIGNHSYSHPHLTLLSPTDVQSELVRARDAIFSVAGVKTRLFRPPYGAMNLTVRNIASNLGLSIMMWNIDTVDWTNPGSGVIVSRVLSKSAPGGIVVMHSTVTQTRDALPVIIEQLRAKGYTVR